MNTNDNLIIGKHAIWNYLSVEEAVVIVAAYKGGEIWVLRTSGELAIARIVDVTLLPITDGKETPVELFL